MFWHIRSCTYIGVRFAPVCIHILVIEAEDAEVWKQLEAIKFFAAYWDGLSWQPLNIVQEKFLKIR